MIPPILTLIAAILAAIAVGLIPGQQAIKDGETERYDSWGRGAVYFLALVILAFGGYIAYIWYSGDEEALFDTSEIVGILHTSNMVIFVVLGVGLMANNAYVSKAIGKRNAEVDEDEAGVEVLDVETVEVKPKKKVLKKGPAKKAVKKKKDVAPEPKPKKVQKKRPKVKAAPKPVKKPKKVVKKPKPAKAATEELIVDEPEPSGKALSCPSCDTPVDHSHDSCPICGEDIKG